MNNSALSPSPTSQRLVLPAGAKPYYQDDSCAIFLGDCRDVLASYEDQRVNRRAFDLLLTDPPYGIKEAARGNASRSCIAEARDYGDAAWDDVPAHEGVAFARGLCRWQMICGGNYYPFPPAKCWLVWDKRDGIGSNDQADAELVWTNLDRPTRLYRHLWSGLLRAGEENVSRADKLHPNQKPVGLGIFALGYAKASGIVYDGFMGSGSFIVAAKRMGLQAVGVDLSESNCEIAAKRLSQGALPLEMGA